MSLLGVTRQIEVGFNNSTAKQNFISFGYSLGGGSLPNSTMESVEEPLINSSLQAPIPAARSPIRKELLPSLRAKRSNLSGLESITWRLPRCARNDSNLRIKSEVP